MNRPVWQGWRPAVSLTLVLTAVITAGAASTQTLSEVLETAYSNSSRIQSARSQVVIRSEDIVEAKAGLAPTFSVESRIRRPYEDPRPRNLHASTDVSLKGRVLLYDGGVQKLAIGQTDSHLDIAELRLDSTIHQVMLDAIVAYHEVIKAQGFLNLAQNSLAVIEEEMEAARNRFRLGAIARTDISFVESRLAAARGDVQLREGELEIAREQFSFIVGEAPGRLATETRFPDLPASLEDALAIANQNSPALAIARKQVEIAEDDHERAERGLRFPRITFGGQTGLVNEFGSGGNTTRSAVFDITGSFTLSNGGAGQALLRQAAEQINSSRMNLRYQTNIVRQRVTNAWVRIEIARSNVTTAREQVEHTQLAFNGTRAEAALGARSTLDVLDAEQDYLQALTNQISAENDAVIAIYRLFGETGTLTPELLNLSVNPQ